MFEALFKYTREDYAQSDVVYLGDWPTWLVPLLALAALALIVAFLARRRRESAPLALAAIGVLQLAMVGVVLWVLMEPNLATDRLREGENAIALVADSSASMAYGDGETRLSAALSNLAAVAGTAGDTIETRFYELGSGARNVPSFVDTVAADAGTALGDGLAAILQGARFSPLAAVVLASDGADTSGGLTPDRLAELSAFGVPIHTIGVGRTAIPEDLELAEVTVPSDALPGSTISARVSVRHDAPGDTQIKVYDGDDLQQILPLALGQGSTTSAWVEVELGDAGPHQLRFAVDGRDGETEFRNNSRSALVNVASERYRVLYFEGEPRWEYKFMRRAVADDEDLAIATLLRVSPNKYYRQGIDSPDELADGFPTARDRLFGYDALILGSVEAALLSTEQQELVRDFVSVRGGSLLMLAGPSGLGNGGWGQSAVADVLPARLPPTGAESFRRLKVPVAPTPQGLANGMLRFSPDDDENRAAWAELPEVADYQVIGSLKPAAETLLTAETEDGRLPLLIGQPYGRGHAYILATGGTWRWQMSMPQEDRKHETFWRQLLRTMVANAPDEVSLTIGQDGDALLELRAEFRDEAFRPLDDVGVSVIAVHESGESAELDLLPDDDEPGVFVATFAPPDSGTWYLEAVAARAGEPIAVGRSSVLFESGQAEYFGFRRDAGLLRRISEATGGRYFDAGELDGLDRLLRYSGAGITETEYRPIWNAPAAFLLLLFLKAGEWLLRRRWGSI